MLLKRIVFCSLLCNIPILQAASLFSPTNIIHTVTIITSWCGNLALSTKVGKWAQDGSCHFEKETTPHGTDGCGPYYLNGLMLKELVGSGYTCAATHVKSNVGGLDATESYRLISNSLGSYVATWPSHGEIKER